MRERELEQQTGDMIALPPHTSKPDSVIRLQF